MTIATGSSAGTLRPAAHRRDMRRIWISGFVLLFATIATWSLATPLGAVPDEPSHLTKAAAVVRGNFAHRPSGRPGVELVAAPRFFGSLAIDPVCYAFDPRVPAGCAAAVVGPDAGQVVDVPTGAARYPPLYYLLVGTPLLAAPGFPAIYAARLLSAALSAALLASAFISAAEGRRRLPVLGILVAATPTVYFFAGAVNPSGFEAAAAICLWASLLRLGAGEVARGWHLPTRIAVSGSALALSRGLSPVWLVAIVGLVLTGMRWCDVRRAIAPPAVRRALLTVGVAAVVAEAYVLAAHTLTVIPGPQATGPTSAIWRRAAGQTAQWAQELIAVLGWYALTPALVVGAWLAATGCALLTGLAAAPARMRFAIVGTTLATLVLPIAAEATTARHTGFVWQGRYVLPIAVGVPLLAGFALARHPGGEADARRLAGSVASMVGLGLSAAFYLGLRRHLVGVDGPLNPLTRVPLSWHPPLPGLLLLGAFVLLTVALCGWVTLLAGTASSGMGAPGLARHPGAPDAAPDAAFDSADRSRSVRPEADVATRAPS